MDKRGNVLLIEVDQLPWFCLSVFRSGSFVAMIILSVSCNNCLILKGMFND